MQSSIDQLYQHLKKSVKTTDLSQEQKDEFVSLTKAMDTTGHEIMYIAIRIYELETTSKSDEFPYGSKIVSKELRFDLETFPLELKWILYSFATMHVSKMKEEQSFNRC
jgi:hypothetical protein